MGEGRARACVVVGDVGVPSAEENKKHARHRFLISTTAAASAAACGEAGPPRPGGFHTLNVTIRTHVQPQIHGVAFSLSCHFRLFSPFSMILGLIYDRMGEGAKARCAVKRGHLRSMRLLLAGTRLVAPRHRAGFGLVLLCQSILAVAAFSSTESIDDTCFCIKILLMWVGLETEHPNPHTRSLTHSKQSLLLLA